jgi:zinc protease
MNHIGGYIMIFLGCLAFTVNGIASDSNIEPVRTVLDNGMVVIAKENHAAPVVSLYVTARAGSIYEREFLGRGISHNLEHLMHGSGTKNRNKEQINKIMEEIGKVSNAHTARDHAAYYITTASSYFDTALSILSDNIQNAEFPHS